MKFIIKSSVIIPLAALLISAGDDDAAVRKAVLDGRWAQEYKIGMSVSFNEDGTFEANENFGQDGQRTTGRWTVRKGKINLTAAEGKPFLTDGRITDDKNSLIYSKKIEFTNRKII